MSIYVSVQGRGTIAIPAETRKRFHLDEPGAQVEVIEDGDTIILKPKLPVDASQAWYWQAEWIAGERQADAEATAGLGTVHESGEDFLNSLDD